MGSISFFLMTTLCGLEEITRALPLSLLQPDGKRAVIEIQPNSELRSSCPWKTKTHFRPESVTTLPFDKCIGVESWVERYYDTEAWDLIQNHFWLRYRANQWNLKVISTTESLVQVDKYILQYQEFTNIDHILQKLSDQFPSLLPDSISADDIVNKLVEYASFMTIRYKWENELFVDVCQFDQNDFFVVGTCDPTSRTLHPFCDDPNRIIGHADVNSKIVEYLKTRNAKVLDQIKLSPPPVSCSSHLKSFDLHTPLLFQQQLNQQLDLEQLLIRQYVPPEWLHKHAGRYVVIVPSSKPCVRLYRNYRDASRSEMYKKHEQNAWVVQIPSQSKPANCPTDDIQLSTRRNARDTRKVFAGCSIHHIRDNVYPIFTGECIIDTGNPYSLKIPEAAWTILPEIPGHTIDTQEKQCIMKLWPLVGDGNNVELKFKVLAHTREEARDYCNIGYPAIAEYGLRVTSEECVFDTNPVGGDLNPNE